MSLRTLALLSLVVVISAGQFDGKVCYITGGTSGLGEFASKAAAAEGCKVVLTGRRAEKGEAVVEAIKDAGGEASFFKCDVSDAKQVEASINFTVDTYGSLDMAFNNAGMAAPTDWGPPHLVTPEDWQKTTNINLDGVFFSAKYEVDAMIKLGIKGSIVNCGSIYSFRSTPIATAYSATKHALRGLTKSFALAYASIGIRVNNLNPAFSPSELTGALATAENMGAKTVTEWHPSGRWLQNQEVIDGLFWLWSGKSSFYSGQDLVLDSGMTASWVPPATFTAQIGAAFAKLGEAAAAAEAEKKSEL